MLTRILTGSLLCVLSVTLCMGAMAAPAPAKPIPVSPENMEKLWTAPDSTVIGTINGANVTKGELARKLWVWDSARVLNDLLMERYITTEAKKAKVTVSQKEIDAKVAETAKQMGATTARDLMARFGLTRDRLYSGIRLNLLAEKVVRANINVQPNQLAQYVKASHILIKFNPAEPDMAKREAAAKTKIDEVAAKLKAGGDFATLAKEFSEDGTKEMGGDLGWFTKGRMVKEFETAAFTLKPGDVSEPIKTQFGYHLIKVSNTGNMAGEAEKATLVKEISETKMNTDMQAFFTKATEAAKKANKLTLPAPPPPQMPPMRMGPPPGPTPAPPPGMDDDSEGEMEEDMPPPPIVEDEPTPPTGEGTPPVPTTEGIEVAPATEEAPPPPPGG